MKKYDRYHSTVVLFDVLNELSAITLVLYQLTYRGHILSSAYVLPCCAFGQCNLKINISQGSAETTLRCDGICNDVLLQMFCLLCHYFKNRLIFGEDMDKSFLTHGVLCKL